MAACEMKLRMHVSVDLGQSIWREWFINFNDFICVVYSGVAGKKIKEDTSNPYQIK